MEEDNVYCNECGYDMGVGYSNCGMSEDGVCSECGNDNDEEEK